MNGEKSPEWDLKHVQDDVTPHILRMLKDTFSHGAAELFYLWICFLEET